jgi:hypothetical protein
VLWPLLTISKRRDSCWVASETPWTIRCRLAASHTGAVLPSPNLALSGGSADDELMPAAGDWDVGGSAAGFVPVQPATAVAATVAKPSSRTLTPGRRTFTRLGCPPRLQSPNGGAALRHPVEWCRLVNASVVFAAILLGLIGLALMFWLVELTRAKLGRRPPSWKHDYELVPPNSAGRAMWVPTTPPKQSTTDEPDVE